MMNNNPKQSSNYSSNNIMGNYGTNESGNPILYDSIDKNTKYFNNNNNDFEAIDPFSTNNPYSNLYKLFFNLL